MLELFLFFGVTDKAALNRKVQVLCGHMLSELLGIYLELE